MNKRYNQKDLSNLNTTIIDLIKDLTTVLNKQEEKEDLCTLEFFFRRQPRETAMDNAIKHLLPHKEQIKNRDMNYFKEEKYIFSELPNDKFKYYKEIILKGERFTKDDIETVWAYLDVIVALAGKNLS